MNKKRNKKTNLSRPHSCRLNLELDNVLIALADAADVNPSAFMRIEMEKVLRKLKHLIMEQ